MSFNAFIGSNLSPEKRAELRQRVNARVEQQLRRSEVSTLIASIISSAVLIALGIGLPGTGGTLILPFFMGIAILINLLLHSMTVRLRSRDHVERLRGQIARQVLNAMLTADVLDEDAAGKQKRDERIYRLSDDGEIIDGDEDENDTYTGSSLAMLS